MVCGSIGYSGKADDIRNMYLFLKSKGFSITSHLTQDETMNYSDITDFRNKENLSRQIVNHDLRYIKKTDVIVVIGNGPSYGAAIEMFVAKKSGKKVILFAKDPIPTPWPINYSDYRVKNEDELIEILHKLQKKIVDRG
jgi:nucleoside 2-deoxyribosyltransferase